VPALVGILTKIQIGREQRNLFEQYANMLGAPAISLLATLGGDGHRYGPTICSRKHKSASRSCLRRV